MLLIWLHLHFNCDLTVISQPIKVFYYCSLKHMPHAKKCCSISTFFLLPGAFLLFLSEKWPLACYFFHIYWNTKMLQKSNETFFFFHKEVCKAKIYFHFKCCIPNIYNRILWNVQNVRIRVSETFAQYGACIYNVQTSWSHAKQCLAITGTMFVAL